MKLLTARAHKHLLACGLQDWAQQSEEQAWNAIKKMHLTPIKVLSGGLMGIVVLCHDENNVKVVLKVTPRKELESQERALGIMQGRGTPKLLSVLPEHDALVMEYLQATPLPLQAIVRPQQMCALIQGWSASLAPQHMNSA
jgi:hypothetical protein